jgi:hypothetical protein
LNEETLKEEAGSPFDAALAGALARRGMSPREVCPPEDALARRVLEEYGAMFMAAETVRVPPRCVFSDEEQVEEFQRRAGWRAAEFGADTVELQPVALAALIEARREAEAEGLSLTPRGGREAARRTYADTLRLWDSRCRPAIEHWCARGRLTGEEGEALRCLSLIEQVAAVLALEGRGIFFSKDFTKSILLSVAAPGASQHLSMLAFDAVEFTDARVRLLLARHGWFQTVLSDLPHFTYLGLAEEELPRLGLRRVEEGGQSFWIPDVGKDREPSIVNRKS